MSQRCCRPLAFGDAKLSRRQAEALARFGAFFAGSVWDVFVRPRIPSTGPLARLFRTEGASDE